MNKVERTAAQKQSRADKMVLDKGSKQMNRLGGGSKEEMINKQREDERTTV